MSLVAHRPHLPAHVLAALIRDHYGLDVTMRPLPGERDQNVLVEAAADGAHFVFKIAHPDDPLDLLEAQAAALAHVQDQVPVPRVLPTRDGRRIGREAFPDGPTRTFRLASWIPGIPLAHVRARSPRLLADIGRQLARLDRHLATFDHPALHRRLHWDLVHGVEVVGERVTLIGDEDQRGLVTSLAARVDAHLERRRGGIRDGLVHQDANDHNLIVDAAPGPHHRQRLSGIIDFGDMVWGWTVAELAVALAYALLDQPDPLVTAGTLTAGYHAEWPLTADELALVFPLALMRLCTSVCLAAEQARDAPDDEYLTISQEPIRRSLPILGAIPFRLAEAAIRQACGLSGRPATVPVLDWLRQQSATLAPVLSVDVRRERCVPVDLAVDSALVPGDPAAQVEVVLTPCITQAIATQGGGVGIGAYGEVRLLYAAPAFRVPAASLGREWRARLAEARAMHLGIDLFVPAGTSVHAPLDGRVHAFDTRLERGDYGGVVILEHAAGDGTPFYTLYGHLRPSSLAHLTIGAPIRQGAPFAILGDAAENGGWTPHLHLQLILDHLDLGTDFPGVARWSERTVWAEFSPDPTLLVGVPTTALPVARPDVTALLAARRARLGHNLSVAYTRPLTIVRGWRQFLFDDTARRFLDAYNNVPHVGHCHPVVEQAIGAQMAVLNTNTRYLHERILTLAERVAATLPAPLRVCWFLNSASEANELALRLARAHTRRREVVVLEAAYHGHTTSLIDVSPYKHAGPGGEGAPPWVHVAPLPDTYRGRHRGDDAGARYAADLRAVIEAAGGRAGAFLAETCPSVGGQLFLPRGYLAEVYAAVREAGGVCIADEVQTGYGRIGSHFWAFQAHDVVPDIVVMGKSMGNGHPLAAVVTTPEIAASFDTGMEFFSTFGGNPVSCAAGLAVLDVVEREGLQAHARRVGDRLLAGLRGLGEQATLIGDVRGSGLFAGVELVRDRETREPAPAEARAVVNGMRERGVLTGTDGPYHNVVKIRPPMPFDEDDADLLVATFAEVLADDIGG